MEKTDYYQLSLWSKQDRILMDDFNADNEKLDAALKANADAVEAEAAARADAVEDLGRRADARLLKTVTSSASGEESEFSLDGIDWSAWKEVHLVADPYTDSGAVVTVYACGSNAVMCVLRGNTLSDREQHTSIGHMVLYPLCDARKRVSVVDLYEGEIRNVGYQFSQLTHVRMEVNSGHALYAGSTLEVWGAK